MGAPKVCLHLDSNRMRLLMEVIGKVCPWVSTPVYATDNFCIAVLASRILDRRSHPFPVQWVHVWDPPLVPPDGS